MTPKGPPLPPPLHMSIFGMAAGCECFVLGKSSYLFKELWGDLVEDGPDANILTVQEFTPNKYVETPTKVIREQKKKKKQSDLVTPANTNFKRHNHPF